MGEDLNTDSVGSAEQLADSPENQAVLEARHKLSHSKIVAAESILENRHRAKGHHNLPDVQHTPPAAEHYPHIYLWDSGFFVKIYGESALFCTETANSFEAQLDGLPLDAQAELKVIIGEFRDRAAKYLRAGVEETFSVFEGQREDGFIPNMQFKTERRWYEKIQGFDKEDNSSNYTQPPVLAMSVASLFESMKQAGDAGADQFLADIYDPLSKFYDYFDTYRSNSPTDKLSGTINPHETGRDSTPEYDKMVRLKKILGLLLRRRGEKTSPITDLMRTAVDYAGSLELGFRMGRAKGDLTKEREMFWANDVMVNGIYVDNNREMAALAQARAKLCPDSSKEQAEFSRQAEEFSTRSAQVEGQMISDMWFDGTELGKNGKPKVRAAGFYSLNRDKEPLPIISVGNLFALTLPNLPANKLKAVLDIMDDKFSTRHPLPSVATDEPKYDPHNQQKHRLWRGPTWINTNWYLVERGLLIQAEREDIPPELRQRCLRWAMGVTISSFNLVKHGGAREHYDPITSQGQRDRVKNFGWSYLAYIMSLSDKLKLELPAA